MPSAERPVVRKLARGLHAARVRAGLSGAEVARRAGVSAAQYRRFEQGAVSPSLPTLRRLCLVLAVTSDELLGLGEWRTPALRRLMEAARGLTEAQLRMLRMLVRSLPAPPPG